MYLTVQVKKAGLCGTCSGCKTHADCGKCRMCIDKPKFGGPGRKKQKCLKRKCLKRAQTASTPPTVSGMLPNRSMALCSNVKLYLCKCVNTFYSNHGTKRKFSPK